MVVLGKRTSAGQVAGRLGTAVLALLIVGCSTTGPTGSTPRGGGTSASSLNGAASASSRSAPPAEFARSQATTAYLGMWQNMAQAAKTSDWSSPRLAQYATGAALSAISRGMYADHLNGLVTKGQPKNHPRITFATPVANPTTVMIADCGDSTHWLKYRRDNGKLADSGGGQRAIRAEVMKQASGFWKVTRFAVEGLGSC